LIISSFIFLLQYAIASQMEKGLKKALPQIGQGLMKAYLREDNLSP